MGGRGAPLTRTWRCGIVLVVSVCSLAIVSPASAGHHHHGGKALTCRVSGSLSGGFSLSNHGKVKAKRADCKTARKVAKRFPKSCSDAYAAQGKCKIHASARWRCRSRIIGSLEDGAPSRESCKRRHSKLKFVVTYSPPIGGPGFSSPRMLRSGPFDESKDCVDTSRGKLIPPPPFADAPFQIHVTGGVPAATGQALQQSLLNHQVAPILHNGLAVQPRIYPKRLPILVTPGAFNPTGWLGLTIRTCGNPDVQGIVVRANRTSLQVATTTAHEMFHAYSDGINPDENWWEEASATWSEHEDGYPEDTQYDIDLQYPDRAIDSTEPESYPYAMSRFVQFLDDEGLVSGPNGRWPLQRQVITGYPYPTEELASALDARGTSLGEEVAAFWGDRIRATPLHGPQLKPGGPNANEIQVKANNTEIQVGAKPLHTKFLDFKLANNVKRVEFEFDPPKNGYFWGGTTENESEPFAKGDLVSFCVNGSDQDDLEWPGRFPVTFTNGTQTGGDLQGTITVRGTTDAGQCKVSTPDNHACRLLRDAKVGSLLGAGLFPYYHQDENSKSKTWICFYHGSVGEVDLNLRQDLHRTSKEVREDAKEQIDSLGLDRLKDVGSIAGIGHETAQGKTYNIVVFAAGTEIAFFTLSPADRDKAIKLAKRLAGQLD
jgi:hypothetical protein